MYKKSRTLRVLFQQEESLVTLHHHTTFYKANAAPKRMMVRAAMLKVLALAPPV